MYKSNIDLKAAHHLIVEAETGTYGAKNIQHTAAMCGEGISFGNVCPASITAELEEKADLLNQIISAKAVFADGTIPLGRFKVTECHVGDYSTTLTAYDALYWATGAQYEPTVGENPTARDVLEDVAQQIGVAVGGTKREVLCAYLDFSDEEHKDYTFAGNTSMLTRKEIDENNEKFLRLTAKSTQRSEFAAWINIPAVRQLPSGGAMKIRMEMRCRSTYGAPPPVLGAGVTIDGEKQRFSLGFGDSQNSDWHIFSCEMSLGVVDSINDLNITFGSVPSYWGYDYPVFQMAGGYIDIMWATFTASYTERDIKGQPDWTDAIEDNRRLLACLDSSNDNYKDYDAILTQYINLTEMKEGEEPFLRITAKEKVTNNSTYARILIPPVDKYAPGGELSQVFKSPVKICMEMKCRSTFGAPVPAQRVSGKFQEYAADYGDKPDREWHIFRSSFTATNKNGEPVQLVELRSLGFNLGRFPNYYDESGNPVYMDEGATLDIQWVTFSLADGDNDYFINPEDYGTPTITAPLTGYTLREMLGYMAGVIGKNALLSRDNELRMAWFSDGVAPADYYSDGLNIRGDYRLTNISAHVQGDSGEKLLTAGDGTGLGCDITSPFITQKILDRIWNKIGGLSGQLGTLSIPYGMETEPGDIIPVTDVSGKTSRLLVTSVTLSMDGGCKADISADGVSESELGAGFEGLLGQAITKLKADLLEVRDLIAENAEIGNLTVGDIKAGVIKSSNFKVGDAPLVYCGVNTFCGDQLILSNGEQVTQGFAIDFAQGIIYGAFYDERVVKLEAAVEELDERLRRLEPQAQTIEEDDLNDSV